ncbi:MAG TPA: hypothetical protein VM031_00960 [Phycisphaerae bacterium]|nr:hypothetical protein [Phycisphaerae bacterium]
MRAHRARPVSTEMDEAADALEKLFAESNGSPPPENAAENAGGDGKADDGFDDPAFLLDRAARKSEAHRRPARR